METIEFNKVQRIKLLYLETWISNNKWYNYAKKFNETNKCNMIEMLGDRSPCRDPFTIQNSTFISGLCRKSTVGKTNDFVVYYTRPCTSWLKDNKLKKNPSLTIVNGVFIYNESPSHIDFYETNSHFKSNLMPNIFNIAVSDAIKRDFDESIIIGNSKIINPESYYKSICYYKKRGGNKYKAYIPSDYEKNKKIYLSQIKIYYNLLRKKDLKVLECKNVAFANGNRFCHLYNEDFVNMLNGEDLLKKSRGNRFIYFKNQPLKISDQIDTTKLIDFIKNIFAFSLS